jgi:hypothetical protein
MKVLDYPQRSPEWYAARLGIPTASNASKIITPAGKRSPSARGYLYALAWERLTGESTAPDLSRVQHVTDGLEREDTAADMFSKAMNGIILERIGFCTTDNGRFGASPDRVVKGSKIGVEIKCPKGYTQLGYLLDGAEDAYRAQIAGQFLVCDFDAIHFWSWHPMAPGYHTIFTYKDFAPYVRILKSLVDEFTDALDEAERKLRAMDFTWDRTLSNRWPTDGEEAW